MTKAGRDTSKSGKRNTAIYRSRLDGMSLFITSVCVIHCLVLPLFLTTLPLWGFEVLENVYVEAATVLSAFFIGGWAILNGYRKYHKSLSIVILFISGLVLMSIASLLNNENREAFLKGAGAVFVIVAHVRNWRKCRVCAVSKGSQETKNACIS